jgi:signal transduction histidine kinase/CheY-like chemotaxis protein
MTGEQTHNGEILVVEDSVASLKYLIELLNTSGYYSRPASSGELALSSLKVRQPDLVLLDISLPGIDGYEVCKTIKANPETAELPVIFLSAYGETDNKVKGFQAGAVDYLTKPFHNEEVLVRVATHLKVAKLQRELMNSNKNLEQRVTERTTELARAHQALQTSEAQLRLALQAGNMGIWHWHAARGDYQCDELFCHLVGIDKHPQVLSETAMLALAHPQSRKKISDSLHKLHANELSLTFEYRLAMQGDDERWICTHGRSFADVNGNISLITGLVFDISSQRQYEKELRQAKSDAETASRAKSAFLANMSHELRTPLNAIMGYSQVLEHDSSLNPGQLDKIRTITSSGNYLLTLLNDILDLAKIEAGHYELVTDACDIGFLLQSMVELFQVRASQASVQFEYKVLTPLPLNVEADEKRLRQILINLLGNAFKFTPQGTVTLSASYELETLYIEVKDSGIGIAKQDLPRIFRPFEQVGERDYKKQGTGLGLAISQRLVQMMDGRLHVDSQIGQGSCFTLELPLPNMDTPELKQSIRNITHYCRPPEQPAYKVLIVDDLPHNLKILSCILKMRGFAVLEALTGNEAIDLAYNELPDLIIMDLIMPKLDGFETTRRILALPECKNIPVIACSASVFNEDKEKSKAAGCCAHLAKPIKEEELLTLLAKCLKLEWCYEESAELEEPQQHTPLAEEERMTLLEYVMQGDIQRVIDYIDALHDKQPNNALLLQLHSMAEEFRLKELADLLQHPAV